MSDFDVVVVGSGNAGVCAALAASEAGARTCLLEKASESWAGGNSYFSAGAFRTTYDGLDDLRPLVELSNAAAEEIDLRRYSRDDFAKDMIRVTRGSSDPVLTDILVDEAASAIQWLHENGVKWELLYERQSFRAGGRTRFWGNLTIGAVGGGKGLMRNELEAVRRAGVSVFFDTPVVDFVRRGAQVAGVVCQRSGGKMSIEAGSVVIAAGGFESNPQLRAAYLGPGWDLVKVRGTPYNTGEMLMLAIAEGAEPFGHWSGCHAIAWDAAAPAHGNRDITNRYSRQAYPFGIVVDAEGRRFLDEGADFRNYTYAKYGADILLRAGGRAFQIFDAKTHSYVSRVDYDTAGASRAEGATINELARGLGLNVGQLERTIATFNASIRPGPFDPSVKDGKGTDGIEPPKSNWAQPISDPPFVGYGVTTGITFTFGGLRIDAEGSVLRSTRDPIRGLYACGEAVGGIFYHNYPGGSGLTSGAVFGRRAGRAAARFAAARDGSADSPRSF